MPLLDLRDIIIPHPGVLTPGDAPGDTIFNGVHFNTTALRHWNYTIYQENNTISNNSQCYLVFDLYQPVFFTNGTWVNATNCYVPVHGIKTRGKLGIAFACIFTVSIMFTLLNLKKHGQQFLREDKRFRLVGRRWQWYWMLFVAACGMISTITSIDVDRDYLQELPIVLTSFFYVLMVPGTLAIVWEAVRHWGSWQERQIVDVEPFSLRQDDKRSKVELYMPLLFYFVAWMNFFMDIPRSWGKLELQRSPAQQEAIAQKAGTDVRFKAGGIIAALAWFVIVYSLHHSMHHYKPAQRPGIWPAITNYLKRCPPKLILALIVLAVRLAYGIVMPWHWQTSIFKFDSSPEWYYGAGYAPSALIIIIFNIWGYIDPNEDKEIMRQRRVRGQMIDHELGIVKRPHWWRKNDRMDDDQRLRNLASEVGGGRATAQRVSQNVELGNMNFNRASTVTGQAPVVGLRDRSRSRPRDDPFRDISPATSDQERLRPGFSHRPESTVSDMTDLSSGSGRTGLTGQTLTPSVSNAPPQRIRSMLDI